MTTVTAWVRINPASTNAQALASNDAVQNISPLIIRLHPADSTQRVEEFQLPYNPIQMRYGDMSDEISQISRPGTTPIVAFKSHRLLTVDFTFLLAQPGDGLATSVDDKLIILRKFAASGNRVISLVNFDSLTNSPHTFRNSTQERLTDGLFFNIVDLSVESVRRNKNNEITQANVSMSLIENRNPLINVANIPPIIPSRPRKRCKDPEFKKKFPERCSGKTTTTNRNPPLSEASIRTALQKLASEKAKQGVRCVFENQGLELKCDGVRVKP